MKRRFSAVPVSKNISKRTINKKVTIHGSSGRPGKGNLIKHTHDDATVKATVKATVTVNWLHRGKLQKKIKK